MSMLRAIVVSSVVVFLLIIPNKAKAQSQIAYYGEEFHNLFLHHSLTNKDVRKVLNRVFDSVHIPRKGQSDQLSDNCPNRSKGKCYQHKKLSYGEARAYLFGKLHLDNDKYGYFISDVYCQKKYDQSDFKGGRGPGPNKIPDHTVLNCEHTWPQHRFNRRIDLDLQKGDLHHLFPSDSKMNSVRGHFRFGEVTKDAKYLTCAQNHIGSIGKSDRGLDYDSTYFEPPHEHKGNVARALFYFSVRYGLKIDPSEEKFLRKWHQEDPVDQFEKRRNDLIFEIQFSRNPFIDYPTLVDQISDF